MISALIGAGSNFVVSSGLPGWLPVGIAVVAAVVFVSGVISDEETFIRRGGVFAFGVMSISFYLGDVSSALLAIVALIVIGLTKI